MTPDAEMAKLLGAVKASGARAIIVGDYRQLDAVGPGGALEALARRHPPASLPSRRTSASMIRPSATPWTSCARECLWRRPGTY